MRYLSLVFRSIIFSSLLLVHFAATAATNEEKFKSAYQAYQQHFEANDKAQALRSAKTAYQAGAKLFGKSSVNTANLAINYATLLNDAGELKKAKKALKGKLDTLEQRFGSEAGELVPLLVELGRANINPKSMQAGLDYFDRASSLAKAHENPLYPAQRNSDIASALMSGGNYMGSETFIKRAHAVYAVRLQPTDVRLGLTSYQMAMWAMGRQQHDSAVDFLGVSLTAFETDDGQMGDLERTVRYRLVETYEAMGLSDASTEHCVALGASQDWVLPPAPVFGKQAQYPREAVEAKLSGDVVLAFTIDGNGFVRNAVVSQSSNAVFDKSALEMIRQYRFAPRFEEGKPIATDGIRFTESFDFAEAKSAGFRPSFQRPGLGGFPTDRFDDPSLCGDSTNNSGRCGGVGPPDR